MIAELNIENVRIQPNDFRSQSRRHWQQLEYLNQLLVELVTATVLAVELAIN